MTLKEGGVRGSLRNITTGASAIPDSAIHQWKFSAGSGSTLNDSIGSNDGTVNGSTWTSGTWVDNYALSHDKTDDYESFSTVAAIDSAGTFTVALSFEATDNTSDIQNLVGHTKGSGHLFGISIESGEIRASIYDGSSHVGAVSGSISLNTKYRAYYTFDNGTGRLWVNDSELSGTNSARVNSTVEFTVGCRSDNQQFFGGNIDNVLIMDAAENSYVSDDYNNQPWS